MMKILSVRKVKKRILKMDSIALKSFLKLREWFEVILWLVFDISKTRVVF